MKLSGTQPIDLSVVKLDNEIELNEITPHASDVNHALLRWNDAKDKLALWTGARHIGTEIRIQNYEDPQAQHQFFQELAESKELPWAQRHTAINATERRFFGKLITNHEAVGRRVAFWRYVQICLHDNVGPSQFIRSFSPEQCAMLELQGLAEMFKRYGPAPAGGYPSDIQDAYVLQREYLRRGPHADNPQYAQDKMDNIRQWALLHLTKYTEDHFCKVGHYRTYNVYLTMPERVENLPRDYAEQGYKTLRYWRRYGIRCLEDMQPLEGLGGQVLPEIDYESPKFHEDTSSRRKRAHLNRLVAQEYFDQWPMAFRPRIPLVAERLNLDLGSRELTQDEIDKVEVQFFEKTVTQGDVYSRSKIWLRLYKVYRAWAAKMGHSEDAMMYEQEVLISGVGWIMMGYSPDSRAALLEYGRGGLNRPSPSNWFQGTKDGAPSMFHEQGYDPARFIPLFQWMNNLNWGQLPRVPLKQDGIASF